MTIDLDTLCFELAIADDLYAELVDLVARFPQWKDEMIEYAIAIVLDNFADRFAPARCDVSEERISAEVERAMAHLHTLLEARR